MSFQINIPDSIISGLNLLNSQKEKLKEKQKEKLEAISKVLDAAIITKGYIYDSDVLGNNSREKEMYLSEKWRDASASIWEYDSSLCDISKVKALGWADPKEWIKREKTVTTIKLDEIIEQCEWQLKETKR